MRAFRHCLPLFIATLAACGSSPPAEPEPKCEGSDCSTPQDGGSGTDAGGSLDGGNSGSDGGTSDGGTTDAGTPPLPAGECTEVGFCWVNPVPHGKRLDKVWMASDSEGFALGGTASLYRFDGEAWSPWSPPGLTGIENWTSLWGISANEVWLAHGRYVRRWNGTTLEAEMELDCSVRDLHGTSSTSLYAVGVPYPYSDTPCVAFWNGSTWTTQTLAASHGLGTVHDLGGGVALALASSVSTPSLAKVYQRASGTWQLLPSTGLSGDLQNLWASAADDVWVIGTGGLFRYDGVSWTQLAPPQGHGLWGLFGHASNDVWISGADGRSAHWDGSSWSPFEVEPGMYLFDIHGAASGDTWAVGNSGTFVRLTPTAVSRTNVGFTSHVNAVWEDGAGGAWLAAEDGYVVHSDGQTFTPFRIGDQYDDFIGIGGLAANEVWAVTKNRELFLYDGKDWSASGSLSATDGAVLGLWAAPPSELWILRENGTRTRWTGTGWASAGASHSLARAFLLRAADDAWLVGESGAIRRWDGMSWTTVSSGTTDDLEAIWGVGSDLWAVGDGIILKWNGTSWATEASGPSVPHLLGVAGNSATDVWAVGNGGSAAHWDGSQWRFFDAASTGTTHGLHAVWPRGDHTLLLGDFGAVLRTPAE